MEQVVIIVITAAWVTPHNLYSQWIRRCEGGRGVVLFPFYNHCPQKESTGREHQTLKFNPEFACCPSHLICPALAEIVIRANNIDLEEDF